MIGNRNRSLFIDTKPNGEPWVNLDLDKGLIVYSPLKNEGQNVRIPLDIILTIENVNLRAKTKGQIKK